MVVTRLAVLALLAACNNNSGEVPLPAAAERVFLNAAVYTVDAERSWAEAVAIADGKIRFVGSDDEVAALIGPDTVVTDLGGQMLLPGFHDSHAHVLDGVMAQDECDLLRLETAADVLLKLQECKSLPGIGAERWIYGGGWGEWLYADANPNKDVLDAIFPDRPVYLESSYGHAGWVNSKALEIAGIDAATEDPPAGIIERDPDSGEPSGTLREAAANLVEQYVPELSVEQRTAKASAGARFANRWGITALIEPGMDEASVIPVRIAAAQGMLPMRVRVSLSPLDLRPEPLDESVFEFLQQRDQWRARNVDVDSVKVYLDGVIEYGTSPLLEPYADARYGSGEFFLTQEWVNELFTRLDAMGLQVHVHAIGDAAIRQALNGFEAMREANGMSDNRHHIVHLQLIHEDDRPRFAKLNVTATFQHLWSYPDPAAIELDVPMLGKERTWQMYPVASIKASGGRIAAGSDYWVTDIDPLLAIEVGVTRQDPFTNEGPVLNESERVDLDTMIEAFTINGAYLMNLEHKQGSIEVGKRADLVVLDRNLFDIPASEISEASVTMTIFDGRTVYERSP